MTDPLESTGLPEAVAPAAPADPARPPRAAEDELIVIRCQLGERDAFDALIGRWHGPLWLYARRIAGSDDAAHDVTQDVWVRVLRGLPGLRDPARVRTWLFGIARRALMDRLRARYAEPASAEDIDPDSLSAGNDGREAEAEAAIEAEAALLADLAALPLVEREALTLFYLRELSLAEVAELLAVPVGTVKSRLHRARRMLRRDVASADRRSS